MITMEQAKQLNPNSTIYHAVEKNSDGTPQRWRITGKIKLWKTRPTEFRLPLKHGLWDYGYLDELNVSQFYLTEEEVNEQAKCIWEDNYGNECGKAVCPTCQDRYCSTHQTCIHDGVRI